MRRYSDLEYLKLNKLQRFFYKIACFFVGIPGFFKRLGIKIWQFIKKIGLGIANIFVDLFLTFKNGDYKTRISYVLMGFGNMMRGQVGRGILFFVFEVVFILYMVFYGGYWLKMMPSLGLQGPEHIYDPDLDVWITIYHDNSFKILLYSVLSIFFIVAFVYTWRLNIKQNKIAQDILNTSERKELENEKKAQVKEYQLNHDKFVATQDEKAERRSSINKKYDDLVAALDINSRTYKQDKKYIESNRRFELARINKDPKIVAIELEYKDKIDHTGKPLKSGKDDLQSLVDDQFHKTLLALPLIGIIIFTVLPIVFMILVAFTNYNGAENNGYSNNLFHWVGWDNFNTILNWNSGNKAYSAAFGEILGWTLLWAFFATFSNYFLGMVVAIMINKKGIKLKKFWRTVLVLTIAIPQFISLLYVSKMFSDNGMILTFMRDHFHIDPNFSFIGTSANPWVARLTIIIINIWIGIPYLMLIATGILMNIPADLYESAQIDGANVWQQYTKITLPYMLFVTGPYLLTSFIGNMNNFNVIYLLTGGGPTNAAASTAAGSVGYTDLLVTWLFKITTGAGAEYYMASVIGILIFVVVSILSLIVYNIIPSTKNEEDFQ